MRSPSNSVVLASIILLSALAVLICGCAGLGKSLQPPKINLANISVQKIKTFEAVFALQLRVLNTNDVPLVIKALDCDLEVNDNRLATGVTETETSIPAYGTGLVDITVYASSLQIVSRFLQGLRSADQDQQMESIDYELSGNLHLGGRALPARIPFSSQGSMSLDRFLSPKENAS